MEFSKYEALGNDFILVDARSSAELPNARAIVRLCERRRGVGADGVIVIWPPGTRRLPAAWSRQRGWFGGGDVRKRPALCGF